MLGVEGNNEVDKSDVEQRSSAVFVTGRFQWLKYTNFYVVVTTEIGKLMKSSNVRTESDLKL